MKNPIYIIILLAIALVVVSYKWVTGSNEGANETSGTATNVALENIMTRTSVRAYTEREVTKEQVDTLLRAAMAAPTAANKQPWQFVVIDNHSILDTIAANFKNMKMADSAPVAIVMCGDLNSTLDGEGVDFWIQDVSASSENLLLAANAMGLGAVWCGIYPMHDRVEDFSKLLSLPKHIIPMACICVGWPSGTPAAKDKWKPEKIHYNKW